ncbi:MAG: hypothetical protein Q7R66_15510 [Undibacterium sp.]|nr:hypothetical protein [Undibacterium sp.]MDO8653590.1 hypothetical protein [Undibacterium sp.]
MRLSFEGEIHILQSLSVQPRHRQHAYVMRLLAASGLQPAPGMQAGLVGF